MCGIVGLLLKKPALRDQLGALMTPMLIGMTSRGPDSAGVAIFGEPSATNKLSLFWGEGIADWKRLSVGGEAFAYLRIWEGRSFAVLLELNSRNSSIALPEGFAGQIVLSTHPGRDKAKIDGAFEHDDVCCARIANFDAEHGAQVDDGSLGRFDSESLGLLDHIRRESAANGPTAHW